MLEMAENELQKNAPSRDDCSVTAVSFCAAAQAGDLNQVQRILEARADIVAEPHPQHRLKALHFAAEEGHAPVVELLLAAGADPLEDFSQSYTPAALVLARRAGHYAVVEAIEAHFEHRLETEDTLPTTCDEEGNTLLHLAVYHRYRTLASSLLAKGADVNARNQWGQRPIDLAIFSNSGQLLPWEERPQGMMVSLLLEAGASMDIWLASALGETHVVRRLLDEDRSAANYYNGARRHPGGISYPLTIAAWRGHMAAVRLLLDHGADPDCLNQKDFHDEEYDERGAPLIMAILQGHMEIAHLLLDRGARANVKIYAGYTALELAQNSGDAELVRRLIVGGARLWPGELAATGNYLAVGEILDRCSSGEVADILLGGVRGTDKTVVGMSLNAKPELGKGITYAF
jgi:ankyrin repeat protein